MSSEIAKAYVQIVPTATGITNSLTNLLGGEADTAGKNAGSIFNSSMGNTIASIGSDLTYNVSRPLVNALSEIMNASMDYEAGMSEVKAISGATADEISALGDKAMDMAAKTKFTTAESAEAYKYMAMAGWDTADMLNALDAVMYLAGASGESLGTTSDIVTDAMTAFGLAADGTSSVLKNGYAVEVANAQRFTDVLAAASNNANTNVYMMGESFRYVAPIAGAMGYSVEDVAIALGLMANAGVKAGMGGTALRNILTNMANPTNTMSAAMQELGVSLEDNAGNSYSLLEVMDQLREGFGNGSMSAEDFAGSMSEIQTAFDEGEMSEAAYEQAIEELTAAMYGNEGAHNAELAAMLAGKYGMAGLLAIVNAAPEDYDNLTEAIYNSNGATQEMYEIMTDNAEGAVTMLNSAINVLFTSLGQELIPAFTDLVRGLTDVVNHFNNLDEGTKRLILTIGGIAIVVGPVLTLVGNVITAVSTLSGLFGGLGSVVKIASTVVSGFGTVLSFLAANPIVLVVAAVAALTAGLVVLWNTNEDFRNWVSQAWEDIKGFFVGAWEAIKEAWGNVGEFFSGIWESIVDAFSDVIDFFAGIFTDAWDAIESVWGAVADFFAGIWEGISETFSDVVNFFGGLFSDAWAAIEGVWGTVVDFFSGIWDGIVSAFDDVAGFFGGIFEDAKTAITNIWDGVIGFFEDIWNGIKGVFSGVWSFFSSIGENMVKGIWEGIKNVTQWLYSLISSWVSSVIDFIKNLFGIHSPSTVFADMGKNLALGLGVGWEDEIGGVRDQIAADLDFGTAHMDYTLLGAGTFGAASGGGWSGAATGNQTFIFYSPEALDEVSAAREMKKQMQRMALGYV